MDCHDVTNPNPNWPALLGFGPRAYAPSQPAPTFDPPTKTCSSVACHMVPAGVFQFSFPGGDGEPQPIEVAYGGVPVTTPPWDAAMAGRCIACHAIPPAPAAGAWHAGHADGSAALNDCALCHPDVTTVGGVLALNDQAALHRDGHVDVTPRWRSSCFGCH